MLYLCGIELRSYDTPFQFDNAYLPVIWLAEPHAFNPLTGIHRSRDGDAKVDGVVNASNVEESHESGSRTARLGCVI